MRINSSVQSMPTKILQLCSELDLGYQEYIFIYYSLSINVKIFISRLQG